uniref:Uncharacterized protein n=1 Tax=Gadus morhua TaxID=8049 RepID=A0A8C5CXU7_GADMO
MLRLNLDPKKEETPPGAHLVRNDQQLAMAIAYFLCVSVAAFILVIYYVFFWTPDAHYNITGNGTDPPNRTDCAPSGTRAAVSRCERSVLHLELGMRLKKSRCRWRGGGEGGRGARISASVLRMQRGGVCGYGLASHTGTQSP